MTKTLKEVLDNAVKFFDNSLAQMEEDFHLKPIADMTDDEYRQWLDEATIAEFKAKKAMDRMFDDVFAGHKNERLN